MEPKCSETKENSHKCPECSKVFSSKYSSLRHFRVVHCGLRSFVCHCGKTFAYKEHLQAHSASKHSTEKPYGCEKGCEKSFASHSARYYHYKMHHNLMRFKCKFFGCDKEVSSLRHLRNHIAKIHSLFDKDGKERIFEKKLENECMLEEDLIYLDPKQN